jgi:signal transduction histidine kinase
MLSASICGTILLVGIIGALASFWFAFDEARDLQDDELREIARLVSLRDKDLVSTEWQPCAEDEPEMRIWLIRTYPAGTIVNTPELSLALPANLSDGLHTVESRGESWRLYVRGAGRGHGFAVAQRTSARDEIARDSALRTLVPFLIVIPILALLTAILIRVLLRQVREVAGQLDEKGDDDFEPLGMASVPEEIIPFVAATNRLLERVRGMLAKHRQFVASAAHELRSPVTAMTLHLENALDEDGAAALAPRLAPLGAGLARMNAIVEQLLSLARLQAGAGQGSGFDGRQVVVEALGEVFPAADAKGVDLGLVTGDALRLQGSEHDFRALARNAIENAVLYTPPGGKVDVRFYRDGKEAVLDVEDTGPGIAQEHLARVFDPFYRVPGSGQPGSGLGLAIIRTAAARLGGSVRIENRGAGPGEGLKFVYRQANRESRSDGQAGIFDTAADSPPDLGAGLREHADGHLVRNRA